MGGQAPELGHFPQRFTIFVGERAGMQFITDGTYPHGSIITDNSVPVGAVSCAVQLRARSQP
jgi:hypothetical protein